MSITIGRQTNCNIVISDPRVSQYHAEIGVSGSNYTLTDHSTNGTIVGGTKIQDETVNIAPDTPVMFAGVAPLDWNRVKTLLPLSSTPNQGSWGQKNSWEQPQPQPQGSWGQKDSWGRPLNQSDENISVGMAILCFFFGIVGIVLFFSWKDATPRKAKQALLIGIASITLQLIVGIILGIVTAYAASMYEEQYTVPVLYY